MARMAWLWLLFCLFAVPAGSDAQERPNILFLFADDQRPDAVGAFGNPHLQTPHIDRLVQSGFRFEQNYCLGSTGGAVCQPSRAMLMSGRTLYRAPGRLKGIPTLGEVLRQAGYATFGTGKWHNGAESFLRTFAKGEAVMIGGMSNHLKVPIQEVGPDGKLTKRQIGDGFSSELFADAAIRFLDGLGEETRPFFAYVSFSAPHDPRQPPERFRTMYYENRPPLPRNFMPQHPFHNGWMTGRDEALAAWPRTREVISDQLCEYYGMITHMDEQIGRILEALERSGRAKNTVIIFSADHGLAVGSHGLLGKQSLYEHAMGCPLVFAGPGIPHGTSRALTYLLDIMPTLCDVTGTPMPEGVEGESLKPIWQGKKAGVRKTLGLAYENLMRSIRDDRYKLICYPPIDHMQLFDLQEDPDELVDLSGKPEHAERIAALRARLAEWMIEIGDPHPLQVTAPKPSDVDLTGRRRRPDRHQPDWIVDKYFDPGSRRPKKPTKKPGK